jgi:hypothetical protein
MNTLSSSPPDGRPGLLSPRYLAALGLAWLAAIVPLISLGHGSDPDTWAVARVAQQVWDHHVYEPSRSSGFPLFELLSALFVPFGSYAVAKLPVMLGALSLFSAFVYMGIRGELKNPRLVVGTLAFLPVMLKSSTSLNDYLLDLSLLTWAYVAMSRGRHLTSALLVGVACGFRPTSAVYMIPILLHHLFEKRPPAFLAKLAALSGLTAVAAYSPMLLTHGIRVGFKSMALTPATQLLLAGYNSLQLFGFAQTLVVLGLVAYSLWRNPEGSSALGSARFCRFHLAVLATYGLVFLAMPHEPEYLLPIVPSVFLLLDQTLNTRTLAAACCALLSYHALRIELMGGESGRRTLQVSAQPGYTYRDIQARRLSLSVREVASRFRPEEPTVLMFGIDEVPTNNADFVPDPDARFGRFAGAFKHRRSPFWIAGSIKEDAEIERLTEEGVRVVLWNRSKGDFLYTRVGDERWRRSVTVIDRLEDLFHVPVEGEPLY